MGIPKGPLYSQLKMGKNVSFLDTASNEMKHFNSSDVVEPSTPPIVVMILYYPTNNVAKQLFSYIKSYSDGDNDATGAPELVIHLTSSSLFHQYGKSHWKQNQNGDLNTTKVDHIFLPINDLKYLDDIDIESNISPFRSAMLGAYGRSLIHPDIYVCPINQVHLTTTIPTRDWTKLEPVSTSTEEYHIGRPTMEYTILPRSKRGIVPIAVANTSENQPPIPIITDKEAMEHLVESSGALTLAHQIISEHTTNDTRKFASDTHRSGWDGELIFTGTA